MNAYIGEWITGLEVDLMDAGERAISGETIGQAELLAAGATTWTCRGRISSHRRGAACGVQRAA
jgi:hypothetical protein